MYGFMAEEILNVADALRVQHGYSGFSCCADISDAVGIRKASIHYHFQTKAGLVVFEMVTGAALHRISAAKH